MWVRCTYVQLLAVHEKFKCKSMSWFLKTVDTSNHIQDVEDVQGLGELRNARYERFCLDSLGHSSQGQPVGVWECHGRGGTQAWILLRSNIVIRYGTAKRYS